MSNQHPIHFTDAKSGIPFTAVIEHVQGTLPSPENKPKIAFYDARYPATEFGQFTAGRYYLETILEVKRGLDLHGGIPEWTICAESMQSLLIEIHEWIAAQIRLGTQVSDFSGSMPKNLVEKAIKEIGAM